MCAGRFWNARGLISELLQSNGRLPARRSYATLPLCLRRLPPCLPTRPDRADFADLWRVLKQLFYEVTGALFAVLALAWLNNAIRAWSRDVAHWLLAVALAVAALFLFFAVTSFRRARKI